MTVASIVAAAIVGYVAYVVRAFMIMNDQTRAELARMQSHDPVSLLAGCRQLIAQYDVVQNDWSNRPDTADDRVLDPQITPLGTNVPQAIRDLKPWFVIVRTNYVLVRLYTPFARASYLGFAEHAEEYGTRRIIPGLWFWSGSDSSQTERPGTSLTL